MSCRPVGAPTSVEEMIERAPHHIYVQVRTEVFFSGKNAWNWHGKAATIIRTWKGSMAAMANVLVDHGPVLFASDFLAIYFHHSAYPSIWSRWFFPKVQNIFLSQCLQIWSSLTIDYSSIGWLKSPNSDAKPVGFTGGSFQGHLRFKVNSWYFLRREDFQATDSKIHGGFSKNDMAWNDRPSFFNKVDKTFLCYDKEQMVWAVCTNPRDALAVKVEFSILRLGCGY